MSAILRRLAVPVGMAAAMAALSGLQVGSQSSQSSNSTRASREVTLRVIVVATADEAQRILDRLNRGENFVVLAQTESIDSSASNGGLLAPTSVELLRPELRAALEGMTPGGASRMVPIPTGYAVVKLVDEVPVSGDATGAAPNRAMLATGSVKLVMNVGGLPEAEAALDQLPKPADWNHEPRTICNARKQSLAATRTALESFLSVARAAERAERPPLERLQAHYGLGQLYAYDGAMAQTIEQYEQALQIARSEVPTWILPMAEAVGVACLHKGEMDNDAYRAPGEMCLIPGRPGAGYAKRNEFEKALGYFLEYLKQKPDDLEVRWLLNLTYMALGEYPGKVPGNFLIPASAFASTEQVGRFRDVAPQAGLDVFATAGGVIVADFENNGRFDVMTSNFDSCGPQHFFHNNGDGTFTDRTDQAGFSEQLGGLNIVPTDYNNDGCVDVLILRGGWEVPQRKSLMRNNCNGTFTDVTNASGLGTTITSTQTAVWTDIDNDGFLDVFIGNEDGGPAQLFLNKGNGTFEDISHAAGVDRVGFTKAVAAADYDNDGFPDLYVSNINGRNWLFRNNHNKTFTELAQAAGAPGSGNAFPTWFFDYDNDGWPDILGSSYWASVDEVSRTYLGLPHNATTMRLYKNMKDGSFRDVTKDVGLDKVWMPMGSNFGDIDNDGFLDIYLGNGNPSYASLIPHVLLRNDEGRSFVDVTASSGTGELHKGHGVAFADLDGDGDEDIVAEIGGAIPGDSHAMRVFENPGNGNDWISLKLVGVKTNRPAIGVRIKVTVDNDGHGTRSIYRTVDTGGSFGASPYEQHIGLGKSARIVDVEIWWPTSGTRQHFRDLRKNQVLEIKEFASDYRVIERRVVPLGGSRSIGR